MTYIADLVIGHAKCLLHQMIRFTDQLHVSILDAIVNHFHKVTGTFRSHLTITQTQHVIHYP